MLCHQARNRLNEHNWLHSKYGNDQELLEHLRKCSECLSLVQAEEALRNDVGVLRGTVPDSKLTISAVREKAETTRSHSVAPGRLARRRYKLALGVVAVLVAFLAFVPFNFKEKVGYEIAIAGVQKSVAMDNKKIMSLLDALGMEKDKASSLLDSLGKEEIRLSVGECSETCHLTISDIKTERDVRLVVKAIIDLGCCQIDDIIPIFRNQPTSLLRLAAKRLLS